MPETSRLAARTIDLIGQARIALKYENDALNKIRRS